MQIIDCAIEEIIAAHPGLYLEHCAVMAVALMSRDNTPMAQFQVHCEGVPIPTLQKQPDFLLRVSWSEQTAHKARRVWQTEQPKPIIERAAVAIAALLFAHFIPRGQMRVTREGERADYWLPQLQCALEVSGTTAARELPRRHREKIAQVLSNPLRWNGYVVVCCFAARRKVVRWSYHQQKESVDESP